LQTGLSNDTQIKVSRSLAKLKSIFLTFDRAFANDTGCRKYYNKQFDNFWSPMAGDSVIPVSFNHHSEGVIKHLQIQIGSNLYPEYPIRSHSECFYSPREALSKQHAFNDIVGGSYPQKPFFRWV
jgi:hypothetical protein